MALSGSRLAQELVKRSLALYKRLGQIEEDSPKPFFLLHPEENLLALAAYGRNPDFPLLLTIFPKEEVEREKIFSSPVEEGLHKLLRLYCALLPPEELPEDWVKFLKRGGFHPSPKARAPFFFFAMEDKNWEVKDGKVLRLILLLLNGILKAFKMGLSPTPSGENPQEFVTVVVEGEPLHPKVRLVHPSDVETPPFVEEPGPETRPSWDDRKDLPPDLAEWKKADFDLTGKIADLALRFDPFRKKPVSKFFGSREDAEFLNQKEDHTPFNAYFEWFALDYRPAAREETVGEKLLKGRLSPKERALLEARIRAVPSFYKVEWTEKGKPLGMTDLFTGEKFTVWDLALSETAEEGLVVPAKIYEAGDYRFLTLFGPPLKGPAVDMALSHLKKLGMKFTPEAMKKKSHLFGRLFAPIEALYDKMEKGPVLRNTDGDPLVLHTASFRAADMKAFQEALAGREDMEFNPESAKWTWSKKKKSGNTVFGDSIILGSIRIIGDEVLLEVNSEKRYRKGRKILEEIPGVTFLGLTTRPITMDSLKDLPLDDRLPGKEEEKIPPKELRRALEAEIRKYYMKWLDEPIPALDGKTPRQACATEEGRRRVAAMIRTTPPVSAPGGVKIQPPKKEMLRELGLGEA